MTCYMLAVWVNETLGLDGDDQYSEGMTKKGLIEPWYFIFIS